MATGDLRKLWKLHLVDHAILLLKQRAANLDPGKAIQAEIQTLEADFTKAHEHYKALSGEEVDLSLKQRGLDDKLKRIDGQLYGGQTVNPREVENFEKEIAALKRQKDANEVRMLEVLELMTPAKAVADGIEGRLNEAKKKLAGRRKVALQEKEKIEAEFKQVVAQRPALVKEVPPGVLARYDAIRNRHGGIGIAMITKKSSCEACGTRQPEQKIVAIQEDRMVTCDECHRLLYYTDGLI